jgi:hypothetical protein
MATIFLSHSSLDIEVARKLAHDLRNLGNHQVWFDEWEIHVGESIHSKIEEGLKAADFLVLLLSKSAIDSRWVEQEWRNAHWKEVEGNSVALMTVLLEPCVIPGLLQTKRYADFTQSYEAGLRELLASLRYFESLKLDTDFFRVIPTVWAEEWSLEDSERSKRNQRWDGYEKLISDLSADNQGQVQIDNSLFYLEKYGLRTTQLKKQLNHLGFFSGVIDENFDQPLTDAILRFQVRFNLRHTDGFFGPLTYMAMAEAAKNMTKKDSVQPGTSTRTAVETLSEVPTSQASHSARYRSDKSQRSKPGHRPYSRLRDDIRDPPDEGNMALPIQPDNPPPRGGDDSQ